LKFFVIRQYSTLLNIYYDKRVVCESELSQHPSAVEQRFKPLLHCSLNYSTCEPQSQSKVSTENLHCSQSSQGTNLML